MSFRKSTHAGSWYPRSALDLSKKLNFWLRNVERVHTPARAIIAPHAGYDFCGSCSAHAYKQIEPELVKRVFILGPSHYLKINGCALMDAQIYQTPLYDINVDNKVNAELSSTSKFMQVNLDADENEHSIEMHLPFLAKIMEDYKDEFKIVPILVGALNSENEAVYGKIFSRYLEDPENLFIISSDFCHWGKRFRFTFLDKSFENIYESIENLDGMGMKIIENLNPSEFTHYLKSYGNTICGRHAIGVLMQAVKELLLKEPNQNANLKFLNYSQSHQCLNMDDCSVSYAAASLLLQKI